MSIEKELKKDGIIVLKSLDRSSANSIAQNVSKKLYSSFHNFGLTYDYIFYSLSQVNLYTAKIPDGFSEASYFYKNSSIYFKDGLKINDIIKFSIHEYIHHLQARKNKRNRLLRMGLCEFDGGQITGMALNEAAVQILTSNILNYKLESVDYYGIKFSTISPNIYPLICNLVSQMSYITGEDVLFESTLNANDNFKNKFIKFCGEKTYEKILINLDEILEVEEKIILLSNKLQNEDMVERKKIKISNKIQKYKNSISKTFFDTQNLIITSYSKNMISTLVSPIDISNFRTKLYNFQNLIGFSFDNMEFNNFYIKIMEKLDSIYASLTKNTYLVPISNNKIKKVAHSLNAIAKFLNIDDEPGF